MELPVCDSDKTVLIVRHYQWRNKVAVGPRASIPKGPPLPHSGFVCSVNKQLRILANFS